MEHAGDPLEGHPTYRTIGLVGNGTQAIVVLARKLTPDGYHLFAVKCMPKSLPGGQVSGRRWFHEALCLKRTRHCRVTAFHEMFNTATHLCIAMEYVYGHDLQRIMNVRNSGLGEGDSLPLFRDIGFGLRRIHSLGVAVRDLKAANVLVNTAGNQAKICDLGFARPIASMSSTRVGTALYMAPELLVIHEADETFTYDGKMADIWSLGVLLYFMIFGECPFVPQQPIVGSVHTAVRLVILQQGLQFPLQPHTTENCKDLIRQMLTLDPRERLDINAVVAHPWFASGNNIDNDVIYPLESLQTDESIRDQVNTAVIDTLHLNN